MHTRRELRIGIRLLVMALVFLAMSCESDGGSDGCLGGTDGLITGCSDGCGTGITLVKGQGCLGDCLFDNSGGGGMLGGCDSGCGGDGGCMGDCDASSILGEGCEGCSSDEPYDYGNGPMVEGAVQIDVTDSLFSFLSDKFVNIIQAVAGDTLDVTSDGKLSFCIPESDSVCTPDSSTTCEDGTAGCPIDLQIQNVAITPRNGNEVNVRVDIGDINGTIGIDTSGFDCVATISRKPEGEFYASLNAQLPVNTVDNNTEVYVAGGKAYDDDSDDYDNMDINIDGLKLDVAGDGALCDVGGAAIPKLKDTIVEEIEKAVGAVTCRGCDSDADCGGGGVCNSKGVCMDQSGRFCQGIQLGAQVGVNATGLLSGVDPGAEASLGLKAFLGSFVQADASGLKLGMRAGAKNMERSSLCVPMRLSPIVPGKHSCVDGQYCDPLDALNGTFDGEAYHVGIGVSEAAVNEILWAAYSAGALCLSVGGDNTAISGLEMLNTGTVGLLLPSLASLTYGVEQPLMLQLRPQFPPQVTFENDPDQGLVLKVYIKDLAIDFYTVVEHRYQRLFTLKADINLPVSLDIADNKLNIAIGNLADVIDAKSAHGVNVQMISRSDVAGLVDQLPSLIGGLAGQLLPDDLIKPIDLGENLSFSGLQVEFVGPGMAAIEEDGATAGLGLFVKLGFAAEDPNGLATGLTPELTGVDVNMPDGRTQRRTIAARLAAHQPMSYRELMPDVVAHVAATGADVSADEVQYAYSINGGPWSFWKHGPDLRIDNPMIAGQDKYHVRIMARRKGDASSGSGRYAQFDFVHDYTAPQVALEARGSTVDVRAVDNVYDADELTMQVRLNGGAWSERTPVHAIDLQSQLKANDRVVVDAFVEDPSGNVRSVRRTFGEKTSSNSADAAPNRGDTTGAGCSSGQNKGGLLGIVFLLGLLFVRRRSDGPTRRLASPTYIALCALCIVGLAMMTAGCKKNTKKPATNGGNTCDPICQTNEECNDGVCQPASCSDGDPCAGDGTCVDGQCRSGKGCRFSDDCEHGQFCSQEGFCSPSECTVATDCSAEDCENGELATCDYDDYEPVEAGECLCAAGLSMGNYGAWLNLMKLQDGSVVALAYHNTYGDLIMGTMQDDGTFTWDFVDGVPDGPVVYPPAGTRGGIKSAGDDAGRYVSAVYHNENGTDVIYAAYQYVSKDDGSSVLRYARGVRGADGWAWKTIDVDTTDTTGLFPSIVLMPPSDNETDPDSGDAAQGGVAILYMTADVMIPASGGTPAQYFTEISSAYAPTRQPQSAEDFSINEGFDQVEKEASCGGGCAEDAICLKDTNTCAPAGKDCAGSGDDGGCAENELCAQVTDDSGTEPVVTNTCVEGSTPTEAALAIPRGIGLFTTSAVDKNGIVHTAYYDQAHGVLKYATLKVDGGKLTLTGPPLIVDGQDENGSTGDVGRWPNMRLLGDGRAAIFYEDAGRGELRAAITDGVNATVTVLDNGAYADPREQNIQVNRVGTSPVARPLPDGGFEVFYQDDTGGIVRRVVWSDIGSAPEGYPYPAFGNQEWFSRDPHSVSDPGDASRQAIAKARGAYGFFLQVLDTDGHTLFASKRIGFDYGAKKVKMDVTTGSTDTPTGGIDNVNDAP